MILKLVLAITGASGAIYGIKMLEQLEKHEVETHLIISDWGKMVIEQETQFTVEQVKKMATFYHESSNLAASIASGSFKFDGMIIAPCSMKTLSGIANGYSNDLITRAADVALKEKRRLVLLVRESPLNSIHLENMLKLSREGVFIAPPVPAFYSNPETLGEIVMHSVGRALDIFDIKIEGMKRWGSKIDK